MSTLLLSTAENLYWLGRYMRRTQELVGVKDMEESVRQQWLGFLGFPTDLSGTKEVEEYIFEFALPKNFEHINDNVQAVRGVIDADAAELFNQNKRLVQSDSIRSAGFQLYACAAAMKEQSPHVTMFWLLGDCVELLDYRIRQGKATSRHYTYLADVVTKLPSGTGWDRIKQQVQAMVYTMDSYQYHRWHKRLMQLFREGV